MKKTLLFLFGLFFSFGVSAQVLYQQDFSSGTMPPTGWMIMGNPANWSNSATSNAGGTVPEMRVTNTPTFPNSSMRIISSQVNTTGFTQVIIRFKHMFDHAEGNSSPFTLGLDTRSNNGTWTNVWTRAATADISAETVTVVVSNANVGAASFQFSLTITGPSVNMKDWFIDDIVVLNPLTLDGAMAAINIPSLFVGKQAVKGEFSNLGQTAISSANINYQTDEGEIFTTPLTGLNVVTGSNQTFECADSLDLPNGVYTLKVWVSNLNGSPADDDPANDTMSKSISIPIQLIYYRPFFEEFTSSTCAPCASFNNSALNPFIAQHENDITLIKYQMSWPAPGDPYYTAEGGVRRSYYNVNAVPDMYIDGKKVAATSAGVNGGYNTTYGTMTYVAIESTHEIVGNNVIIDANIVPYANYPNVKIHMAIVERITTQNVGNNGETEFHHVMMKMVPDASGTSANLVSGETLNLKFNMDMSATNVEEMNDLMLAVFIQDNSTKGIYQSGYSVEVGASITTNIDDNAIDVPVDEPIVVDFSQPIRMIGGQAITNSNVASLIMLKEGDMTGVDAGFTATINAAKTQIVVTPNPDLKYLQRYFFRVLPVENYSADPTLAVTRNFTTVLNVGVPQVQATDVRVYPNPATNMLYISNIAGIGRVEIYSVVGNLVKSISEFPNSRGQAGISVSDLSSGLYIIRLKGSSKDTTTRFVISR